MATSRTELKWQKDRQAAVTARDNPPLQVAPPPEFGGPERTWNPEELFVASIQSCLMITLLHLAERFGLSLAAYTSTAESTMEKTPDGMRITGAEVHIEIAWADDESLAKAESLGLKAKLEKYCPISNALSCPLSVQIEMQKAAT